MFALSGIGVYARTKGSDAPRIEGAYKIRNEWQQVGVQLERIAQGIEDLVAANKDSFQRDMGDRFEKLEAIMEHQAQEREARGEPATVGRVPVAALTAEASFELDEERDDGYLYASGRAERAPKKILQPQQFGESPRPPLGSFGMQIAPGGDHSRSLLIGVEHPTHRPEMSTAETVLYNQFGQVTSIIERNVRIIGGNKVYVQANVIVRKSFMKLGSGDSSRPTLTEGTSDSAGHAETLNPATQVMLK